MTDWTICDVCGEVHPDKPICRSELEVPLDELSRDETDALERSVRDGDWRKVSAILVQRWKTLKGEVK